MQLKRKYVDYALAGLLLLLPVFMLRASLKEPESLNRFDEGILRISSPLQSVASWVIGGIGGLLSDYVWLVTVEDENDELRAQNLRLREELGLARREAADFVAIEGLVGLKRSVRAETAAAHVISSSINANFRVSRIRIDRGEGQIEVGMPVISADGLAGRILHTYGAYSDVLLVSDPQSSIDIKIPATGGRGLLSGIASDSSYVCKIEYLERGKEVKVGDTVVTSGLGKHFPGDLAVGVIESVDEVRYGLYQKVSVRPSVKFSSLGEVLILLAAPPPADPDREKDKASAAAHGVQPF